MSIISSSRQKRYAKSNKSYRTITGFLRDHTSSLDFGVKVKRTGRPVHANKNKAILAYLNHRSRIDRMTVSRHYTKHFDSERTYYFAGNSYSKAPRTLLMIDIDCHRSGTLLGAKMFAEWIKTNMFAGMYYETSTNGNGIHGYVVVVKQDLGAETLNELFDRLERNLRRHLKEQGFDVEDVEVKGTLPVIKWQDKKAISLKAGQLAKIPREAHRWAELAATTVVEPRQLFRLPIIRDPQPETPKVRVVSGSSAPSGSISGHVINDDEVERITGHYSALAETLIGQDGFNISDRAKVTTKDVAVFLCLLKFFTANPNRDNSLPVKRFRELWQSLFFCEQIDRQFDPQRFAAIRDLLTSFGLIDWVDANYRVGIWTSDGKYLKGQAAKWKASTLLLKMMGDVEPCPVSELVMDEMEEHSYYDDSNAVLSPLFYEGERRESILYANTTKQAQFALPQLPTTQIIRPFATYGQDNSYLLFDPYSLQWASAA